MRPAGRGLGGRPGAARASTDGGALVTGFADKVAVVTGGAGGIGSAICPRLAADGHHVVIGYHTAGEAAQELAGKLEAAGYSASAAHADVTDAGQVAALFSEVVARHRRVDVVVNNAGTMVPRPLTELTGEVLDRVFDVNVRGALN